MAMTTFCDWCGERMEIDDSEENPFGLFVSGTGENGSSWIRMPLGFHVHIGGMTWPEKEVDPDSCFGQLMAVLDERKSWAHDRDQPGAEWRLVDREGRLRGVVERRRRVTAVRKTEPSPEEKAKREAEYRRCNKWSEYTKAERKSMIRDELLREPSLTAREIAEHLEDDDMRVWADGIRPLVKEMYDEGVLAREEERYGAGSRIRFRYAIPEEQVA